MSDLEILAKFRQAEAAGNITKMTKSTHECLNSGCDGCFARSACQAIVCMSTAVNTFETNYRNWAKRTTFYDLPYLQQHYPELLI